MPFQWKFQVHFRIRRCKRKIDDIFPSIQLATRELSDWLFFSNRNLNFSEGIEVTKDPRMALGVAVRSKSMTLDFSLDGADRLRNCNEDEIALSAP